MKTNKKIVICKRIAQIVLVITVTIGGSIVCAQSSMATEASIDIISQETIKNNILLEEDKKIELNKNKLDNSDCNIDIKNDNVADLNIDIDGDGEADLNIDIDSDGEADLNIDIDSDGKADLNIDIDGDGKADLNIDIDGDGKADLNIDFEGDGTANLNIDIDNDGKADLNIDTNGDGLPNLNLDINADLLPDLNIDSDGDGNADDKIDSNGDGKIDKEENIEQPLPSQPQPQPQPQPVPQPAPQPTVKPVVPTTPTPPAINYVPTPNPKPRPSINSNLTYDGPVKQWNGIPNNSKRYQLKKAAESMIGWHYSQPLRMADGYRDCSSFVHTAVALAGFTSYPTWAWTTYSMPSYTDVVYQIPMSDLRPGDIIVGADKGHVAFYWGEDAMGYPQTLECCGGLGVTYGYMNSNGWNYLYDTAWRIVGIDESMLQQQTPLKTQNNSLQDKKKPKLDVIMPTKTETEEIDKKYGAVNPNACEELTITADKFNGKTIELLDLNRNPVQALTMYVNKNMTANDYDELYNQESNVEKIKLLLSKVATAKDAKIANLISNYVDISFDMPLDAKNNTYLTINSLLKK